MKKIFYISTLLLFVACAPMGYFNSKKYNKTQKLVYERIFEGSKEVTNKATIDEILKIMGTAKKTPIKFITQEQFLFIDGKDTLSVWKNGTSLKDKYGTYSLSESNEIELNKLLK